MEGTAQLLRCGIRGQWEWLSDVTDAQIYWKGCGVSKVGLQWAKYTINHHDMVIELVDSKK